MRVVALCCVFAAALAYSDADTKMMEDLFPGREGDWLRAQNATETEKMLGIVHGRDTKEGEWEGTIMVIGSTGSCDDTGLCTGMFIHPQVVMSAGHCCRAGHVKAICGGKERPGKKLAQSKFTFTNNAGANDFCLLYLDAPVNNVPIYQVAENVPIGDAVIVGYGVSNAGTPQLGAGTQRDGEVQITGASGVDIRVTGRPGQTYQNACNGDSGGPLFVEDDEGRSVVAGVTSRGSFFCPIGSTSIYTSAVVGVNADAIRRQTVLWEAPVVPGECPVRECCYSKTCK
mmetsp:Transcript_9048/g.10236  ORF Transcript_9048/g.10236 Transcript_9048/m.10236 type:complete len:286 (+) Transcript_9048:28-885(+)